MHIYLKDNRVKFHPDQIWNDGALGFFEEQKKNNNNNKNNNKMSSEDVSSWSNKKAELSQRWPRGGPIYECPENFRVSLTTPTATFPKILNGFFSNWVYKCAYIYVEVCSFTRSRLLRLASINDE